MIAAKTPDPARELVRIEALCARSEQCTADLRASMLRRHFTPQQADTIIASLVDRKFVDDNRLARAFTRDKYRFSGWGRHKITAALINRHIDRATIAEALAAIDPREYTLIAFRAIASRLRRLPADMPRHEMRRRLLMFAASRGYESTLILKILDSQRLWTSRPS